jgi:hypothetical protein
MTMTKGEQSDVAVGDHSEFHLKCGQLAGLADVLKNLLFRLSTDVIYCNVVFH